MNIKRAKQEIKNTIEAYLLKDEEGDYVIPQIRQRPVLLLGAPGIGKTQIMEQIARECGIGLVAYTITHHTRQSAIGLPFISHQNFGGREYAVTEYTMSEIVASIYKKMEETGLSEGILFIDEINCVSETLAPAMLQFLQCKTFGTHEIPSGWVIVAAGNPPEYNKSVREFDVVTLDRVKKIEVEPDYAVWKEYALKEQLHPAVIAYLDARPGSFYRMETTVDGRKFATPRGWEDLSQMLKVYETLGKEMDREVAAQYVQHETIARDFANYLELYRKYRMDYRLDEVLSGQIAPVLLKKAAHAPFDERLGVVSLLLSRCRAGFAAQMRAEDAAKLLYEQLLKYRKMLQEEPALAGFCLTGDSTETSGVKSDSLPRSYGGAEPSSAGFSLTGDSNKTSAAESRYSASGAGSRDAAPFGAGVSGESLTSSAADSTGKQSAAVEALQELTAQFSEEFSRKKTARLLTRVQERQHLQVLRTLEADLQELKKRGLTSPDAAFACVKEQFSAEQDALERSFEKAGQTLEYAFDFMEAAYGGAGQEMVVFVTELNADYYSVQFLKQYECERYYRYNKSLLFEDRARSVEARLRELGV